ncbi:MAG TPA: hypothetical protein VHH36_06650 [Candidatus Thermoplasmatota archaeon]|nr:hypothetical protein [Candidatus Thermoplasmatota archaeon]
MNGRLAGAAALILAAGAFAGCIESLSLLSSSDEVAASEVRDLADQAATAWAPDAQLVSVFATEMSEDAFGMGEEAKAANVTLPADPDIGNGRAVLWFFGYVGENGTAVRVFQVNADGEVGPMAMPGMIDADMMSSADPEPLGVWEVDSDEAAEIAHANETFESVASMENVTMVEGLGSEDGHTVWALMVGTQTSQAIAIVDAMDGTILYADAFKLDASMPIVPGFPSGASMEPQVEIEASGSLSMGDEQAWDFDVSRPDPAWLQIRFSKTLPTDALEWAVLDADGNEVEGGTLDSFAMGDVGVYEFPIPDAGSYQLVLRHVSSVPTPFVVGTVDYDLTFVVGGPCAGMPSSGASSARSMAAPCAVATTGR